MVYSWVLTWHKFLLRYKRCVLGNRKLRQMGTNLEVVFWKLKVQSIWHRCIILRNFKLISWTISVDALHKWKIHMGIFIKHRIFVGCIVSLMAFIDFWLCSNPVYRLISFFRPFFWKLWQILKEIKFWLFCVYVCVFSFVFSLFSSLSLCVSPWHMSLK